MTTDDEVPMQTEVECGICVNEFVRRLANEESLTDFEIYAPKLRIQQASDLWNAYGVNTINMVDI